MIAEYPKLDSLQFICLILLLTSCGTTRSIPDKQIYRDINSFYRSDFRESEPYLKAHLANGGLCVYTDTLWEFEEESNLLNGNAALYDLSRDLLYNGMVRINIDTVLLFETNQPIDPTGRNKRILANSVLISLDVALGVICLTNPKACWGSCPTFYLHEGEFLYNADAEGFSEAIRPTLEYGDIDALYNFRPDSNRFSVKMKNEALETHVVREVKILSLARDAGQRVFHGANDRFYLSDPGFIQEPLSAEAEEGDITDLLSAIDMEERFSPADQRNMMSREELILKFGSQNMEEEDPMGLIFNYRQTLMTTYLIYSIMGYMGNMITDIFANLEKENPDKFLRKEARKYSKYESKMEQIFWNSRIETGNFSYYE